MTHIQNIDENTNIQPAYHKPNYAIRQAVGLLLIATSIGYSTKTYVDKEKALAINYPKAMIEYYSAKKDLESIAVFHLKNVADSRFDKYVADLKISVDSLNTLIDAVPTDTVAKYEYKTRVAEKKSDAAGKSMLYEMGAITLIGSILTAYFGSPHYRKKK